MPAKRRLRIRGIKHSSKRLEDDLLDKSRILAANPGILRPQCAGNCRKCAFDKPFKQIDALAPIKTRPDSLIREASKLGGDDIVRAYAGTISLAAAGSVPILATGKIAGENVSYAVRGTVNAGKLIGCQYYDDPRKRLLLYTDHVKKNKLHLYSFGDEIVCSDKPNMPEDYLYDNFWDTPYEFPDDGIDCGHETSAALEIHIKSLDETVRICDNCVKPVSSLMYIISKIATADPMDDIEVRVRHHYHSAGESDIEPITGDRLKQYMIGQVTDENIVSSVKRAKLGELKSGGTATYVIGTTNFGSDLDGFTAALEGDEREIATVKKFLEGSPRTVVLKSNKCSEALIDLWSDDWRGVIEAHTDKATADSFEDMSKAQPSATLAKAYNIYLSADVVASLPVFNRPGPLTVLSDTLSKAAKVGGLKMVEGSINENNLKDRRQKAIAASFILVTGGEVKLKLTADEMELAEYLVAFAQNTINATGEKYREAISTLLVACGTDEKVF